MKANKLLLVASQRLGDVVFATPSLPLLRSLNPNAQIDVLAFSKIAEQTLANNPYINDIFLSADYSVDDLKDRYDSIIPMLNTSYIRDYLAGAANVLMPPKKPGDIHWKDYFNNHLIDLFPELSGKPMGPYELYPQKKQFDEAAHLLLQRGVDVEKKPTLIALHMGANKTMRKGKKILKRLLPKTWIIKGSKCWPLENFRQLVDELHSDYPEAYFVLTGAPSESFLGKSLRNRPYVVDLIGQTKVLQLASLLSYCKVLLTGDTGPLHVACAMKTPVVALFAKTEPEISGPHPHRDENIVIYKKAMEDIRVNDVKSAIASRLRLPAFASESVA